jgi:hypothetical protein
MTKKHFRFAADRIVSDCFDYGFSKEDSQSYHAFVQFFEEMSLAFDKDMFDEYIDKEIEEMKK